jgi:hypothetical protein
MKARNYLELFIIMRDNINMLHSGLCGYCNILRIHEKISSDEQDILLRYLEIHTPKRIDSAYGWAPGLIEPRLRWINDTINLLTNETTQNSNITK